MKALHAEEILSQLKRSSCRAGRRAGHRRKPKHREAELRALRAILIQYEGIDTHHFDIKQKNNHVLLVTNRNHRGILENQTGGKAHPLGVIVQTDDLLQLLQIRTYRDMLFYFRSKDFWSRNRKKQQRRCGSQCLQSVQIPPGRQAILFRIECRSAMTLEQRSRFVKSLDLPLNSCRMENW